MRIFFLSLMFILIGSATCLAQVDERRKARRALFEDLLKNLVETQLEKAEPERGDLTPRPGVQPTRQPTGRPTAEMMEARNHLAGMNNASVNLINELRQLEVNSPRYRPVLADTYKVKAQIDALNQLSARYPDLEPLQPRFLQLDQDWRKLNYQLGQVGGFSARCQQGILELNNHETQLCGLFGVQPQINRNDLTRLTTAMSVSFEHLLQDVYYDMAAEPQLPTILKQGKSLYTQISQTASVVNRGSYDEIVAAHKRCTSEWRKFNAQIGDYPSDRIRRDIENIEDINRQINEQLWLPVEMDRQYLAGLCKSINRDCDDMFEKMTVSQLLACKNPTLLLNSAREFRNQCASFGTSISSGKSMGELVREFISFDTKWNAMNGQIEGLEIPRVRRRLDEIGKTMITLGQTFDQSPVVTRASLLTMIEELDQLTQDLSHEIHHRIRQPRYQQGFHETICGQSDKLHELVHDFRVQIATQRNYKGAGKLNQIVEHWTALRPMMDQCQDADRIEFGPLRNKIEPLVVKLMVIFST